MDPETTAKPMPETVPCVRCRVQINAASGYCTLCGAVQRTPLPARVRLLIAAAGLVAVGAVVVLAAALLGGSGAGPGPALRLRETPDVVTLVPAGWEAGPVKTAPGFARVVFSDPVDDRRRLTVTVERTVTINAHRRARLARALAMTLARPAYRQHFFGRIRFPDGRPAWLLTYDSEDSSRAVYVFSACTPSVAMTVELRAVHQVDLTAWRREIPASAAPRC
jgi:hypothetical protein